MDARAAGLTVDGTSLSTASTPAGEILLLAVAGGGVDAAVYLGFGVLTAAQTGNTILLAVAFSQGHFLAGLHSAVSIASYVVGAAIGQMIVGVRRTISRSALRWALFIELFALGALLLAWRAAGSQPATRESLPLVALAAVSMGIQSAAVLYLHAGPATTYVTGTLTTFTVDVIRWPHLVSASRPHPGILSGQRPWIYGIAWLVYLGGAAGTGLLFLRIGSTALLLPIAAIAIVLVVVICRPSMEAR
jgi:uncharacterized membrane protein YoaK (UPF0700 family)